MLTKLKLALALSATLITGAVGIAAAQSGPDNNGPVRQAILQKYDTNGDGVLDANERAAMRADCAAKQFAKMDTNGDGQVTLAEFQAFKAARGGRGGWRRHH